ncbi:hypothetical protein LCGC14_0495000 [marine sediment metagenome]|uniref:Uncharacterized protein n=1 Tax=marine sediment metagenome TaxID=412755 RepID=A0A0F9VE39_9ZZZZ
MISLELDRKMQILNKNLQSNTRSAYLEFLEFCREPKLVEEIEESLPYKLRTIRYYLNQLLQLGLLELVIYLPDRRKTCYQTKRNVN